ncbi:hypothetical protein [Streptomyces botrytidirepellens]|uniref:hypothetical protein n=1 Tax=Streptomyces botrytidirepellens TaxID=2486417 RepID=UPI001FE67AE9|nr:hypothetical protein [Streptomyces botrytidirepellens]
MSARGIVLAATAGVLCGGQAAWPAASQASAASGPCPGASDEEPEEPAPVTGSHIGLVVIDNVGIDNIGIDNSSADSWLEIDRTLDTLLLSAGTAGSDHEGGSGD